MFYNIISWIYNLFYFVSDVVVVVAVIILIGVFCMQHHGTDKVGWLFAPIVLLWFILIGSVGAVNIWRYNKSALKAYNPVHIYRYFKKDKYDSWNSLGGILLCITGMVLWKKNCYFVNFSFKKTTCVNSMKLFPLTC